ncbi:type IV pre-pilin [Legionella birminghamensis]|uniref:Type II secretion system protein H n=1 Tax=Legionella birminghamensis TaxID=28083 RepID=A0A378I8K3_9GAMM|nr:GspH/FimT family pseudopilin [Legionella birminghamensis]KTC69286.1 type IV pre-pilin [Legionella birminghamensis]STX31548.1 type IV pre-pilin [Legionella birminghamensis]
MKEKGFTLTELIVTLCIAAIFISVAVPGYYSLIQNNKVVAMVNRLSASLNFARMEAIKRGVRVSVCSAGNASLTACGSATQWAQGWIVFVDANNNNLIDSNNDLVKVNEALPSGTQVNANSNIVSYDSMGFVSSGEMNLSVTAIGCKGNNARALNVSASGRLSISRTACQ